jgi:uroporphyrinogen decarboxylase
MKKRDRLLSTMAGEPTDRPAVALWRHFPVDDSRTEALAASQFAFQRLYDFDVMKVSPTSSFSVEDWGVKDRYVGDLEGSYAQYEHPISRPEDFRKLAVLDPTQGALRRQVRCLEIIGEGVRQDDDPVPFIQTVFSPLSQAKKLAGSERRMLSFMRRDPEAFKAGMQTVADTTIGFVEQAKATGMAGIYYAVQYACYDSMSEAEYREFGEPYDRQILESLDGTWFNMVHIHGLDVMFDLLADYPVQAINWHEQETPPSLEAAMQRTDKVLSGGLDQATMMCATPEAVRAKAVAALDKTGGKRFILGVGCVTMVASPWGNIRTVRQVVDEYR